MKLAGVHADGAVHFGDQGVEIGEDGGRKFVLPPLKLLGERLDMPGSTPVLLQSQHGGAVMRPDHLAGAVSDDFQCSIERKRGVDS